ncbi:MAG: GNAT family N-acetyltransferase [Clostridiales bacterium]|nr:GNAT family N-acetyltransferase [Clostridiales bacterium]
MDILPADEKDLQEILALQRLAFAQEAEEFNNYGIDPMVQTLAELEAQFQTDLFLKVLDSDGAIIASTRGHIENGTSYIGRTFVRPDYQGMGIGTALIRELENRNCADRYEINSSIQCPQNIRLYEHLGYMRFKVIMEENNGFVYLQKYK